VDHDFNRLDFAPCQTPFMQISPFIAKWFLKRRFLNDPTLFFHFCNYLPFEKNLALSLNKSESPSPKDDMY
jgi:hypothetical protein